MTRATVTLPDGHCARDVTVYARDNGDGTSSVEAFDAGGAIWPVCVDGVELYRVATPLAPATVGAIGEKLFATPGRRP
jgi:hypothetical protein